jgi:peptidoglycan/LPS O-acetylase OafA/YrhL
VRSSSGAHFIALDHVRALAAYLVFVWHFTHASNGSPIPFDYVPGFFPLSILNEGHTGVALFMTLSGYLFAKLLDGKQIRYRAFIWNRVLRLLPLLALVVLVVGVTKFMHNEGMRSYAASIARGVLFPSLPNGAWSVTVEFHFYLMLPIFLWLLRKSKLLPVVIIMAAIALRVFLHHERGQVQYLAYWTIVGRIDQFALGILAYHFREAFARRHFLSVAIMIEFAVFYWLFDLNGGFFKSPTYPSPSPLWILFPTIEGAAYAIGIAWYDNSFAHSRSGVSRFIGRIGEYSYSLYLLHYFVVFDAARVVDRRIMDLSNFYVASLWSVVCFLSLVPAGYLSYRFVEGPFLRLRRAYVVSPAAVQEAVGRTVPAL